MSDDPQQAEDLIAVRYTDPAPRIINGEGRVQGDIIQLPASEVEAWPQDAPHPYYERAEPAPKKAGGKRSVAEDVPSADQPSTDAAQP